jgi:hypothetical protein
MQSLLPRYDLPDLPLMYPAATPGQPPVQMHQQTAFYSPNTSAQCPSLSSYYSFGQATATSGPGVALMEKAQNILPIYITKTTKWEWMCGWNQMGDGRRHGACAARIPCQVLTLSPAKNGWNAFQYLNLNTHAVPPWGSRIFPLLLPRVSDPAFRSFRS